MEYFNYKAFQGIWRSYKSFLPTGNVKLYLATDYREFNFSDTKMLTITVYKEGIHKTLEKTDKWSVELKNKKHYLQIENSSYYFEVITINHTTLVLLDCSNDEKTFFAKLPHWEPMIISNTSLVL